CNRARRSSSSACGMSIVSRSGVAMFPSPSGLRDPPDPARPDRASPATAGPDRRSRCAIMAGGAARAGSVAGVLVAAVLVVVVVVAAVVGMRAFNRLTRARQAVREAWAQIDV